MATDSSDETERNNKKETERERKVMSLRDTVDGQRERELEIVRKEREKLLIKRERYCKKREREIRKIQHQH